VTTVVLSAYRVATSPQVGGHFWVYMQYAHALRQLGFEVFWLERVPADARRRDPALVSKFLRRLERHGLGGKALLYDLTGSEPDGDMRFIGVTAAEAESVIRRADLLLNFHYAIDERVLGRFGRTALIDVDPGLLQFWMSRGQLDVPPHDVYMTIGETVGAPDSRIDDCGLSWVHIRPPVCLDLWPYTYDPGCPRFTTVSSWLGGEYVTERRKGPYRSGKRVLYRNDKSISFLRFAKLPSRTSSELELAIADHADRASLERRGWWVRHAREVASTPESYRSYVQSSRGEFSCVKPSCVEFQNAWVSDRTLCYMSSGKPVVIQDTGPSSFLPDGEGMFRFSTIEEAAEALAAIESNYERHCRAAREIAEAFFDARVVVSRVIELATGPAGRASNGGSKAGVPAGRSLTGEH
jgi:hypothetical protein